MISTKAIIYDLNQVPTEWPFEFYLNLPEKLIGQDVKIKSIVKILTLDGLSEGNSHTCTL